MRSVPPADVGVLRRHRRHARESRRTESRIQSVDALSTSVRVLHRMKKLFAVFFFVASFARASQTVDIVITGGTVLTMAGPNIPNGGIAIDKGKIVAVGDVTGYRGKETIDARGNAVLPGFVNAHTHVPMVLFRGIADDRELMDWLTHYIFPAEAKNVSADLVMWGTRLAAAEKIPSGTTTFTDMYYFESVGAAEATRAGLRAHGGASLIYIP